jgi:hypothetical protein
MFNIHAYSFVKIVMILHTFSVTVVFKRILDGTRTGTGTKTQTDNANNYMQLYIHIVIESKSVHTVQY